MRKLIVYPNCSKGGVTSVIRGRASREVHTQFDVVFLHDKGGKYAFDDLPNVDVRIVREDRAEAYLAYLVSVQNYDSIHVLSSPKLGNALAAFDDSLIYYEFHSSNMKVVENEIDSLDLDKMTMFCVPSEQMKVNLSERLPKRLRRRVEVVPNLIDTTTFSVSGPADFFKYLEPSNAQAIPLVWVGRFDKDKGYQYAVRLLAQLPERYFGVFVVSLENDPKRVSRFFSECDAMGVRHRVELYMDLPQPVMANLYRSASRNSGFFISTSLMESFGYAIGESISCGLNCVSFELPILSLHQGTGTIYSVPIGDVMKMADSIIDA